MSKKETSTAAANTVVGIDYVLRLDDGSLVDESTAGDPLLYLHGHQNIIAGLERELTGMKVGDKKLVSVAPADGYGEYDDDNVEAYPRDMFPDDMEIAEGMAMQLRDPESGQEFEAIVTDVNDELVNLDFNHPLAGEILHFDVVIASVRPASAEELAHGHAHGAGHGHDH
jgi:FKBP-type peptidyl-prolyl cis-trans isomerase SlyD